MIEAVQNDLKQYFDYIKDVYLKNFDRILDDKVKNSIQSKKSEDIEYDMDADFSIKVNGTIHYRLNINSFIENNHLLEEDLNELGEMEKQRVNYIVNHKENGTDIVKDTLLENMFLLFMPNHDVLSCGMSTYLASGFTKKYHFNYLNLYFKEKEVIENLMSLFGQQTVLFSILNGNYDLLEQKYDDYTKEKGSWNSLYNCLEKEFEYYEKNKNKIYYIDSLYNYSNLNYKEYIQEIEGVLKEKKAAEEHFSFKVSSMLDCLQEMNRYMILLNEKDKNNLYYSSLNLKRILEKEGKKEQYQDEILEIENGLKPVIDYIWNYYINFEGNYDPSSNYWFLVQNIAESTKDDIQVMNLITNDQISNINSKNRYQCGFIYKIQKGAILYSAPGRIIYHLENNEIKIEEQEYSHLLTPRNLMIKTLDREDKINNVLVNRQYVQKKAVYCVCKNDSDIHYEKASELAAQYDLPLIPIYENS